MVLIKNPKEKRKWQKLLQKKAEELNKGATTVDDLAKQVEELKKQIGTFKPGAEDQVLETVTTDPGALADFPAWARTSGNEILKTEQGGGTITFWIKRVK